MKISEAWLRRWVDPDIDTEALVERLTLAGLEVDGHEREGEGLTGIRVAKVTAVERHPNADKLSVCTVSTGSDDQQVVCGAPNVSAGMMAVLAVPGVKLPDGTKLRRAKLRGVESNGMLCSAAELGLGDEHDGILELPADAKTGQDFAEYLQLPDCVIDIDLTPNRGDCFSVLGVAREVATFTESRLRATDVVNIPAAVQDTQEIGVTATDGCPRFAARVIKGIDATAMTPIWMAERLRRSGVRCIHPVVDITNYVMLELGQPMHAYDLNKIEGAIDVRYGRPGEPLVLLDGREVTLDDKTLAVADDRGAIGLAGIMGGETTAVDEQTTDVLFEAAFWTPAIMAGRARAYGMHTDASLRFERGVDPAGQRRAVERATALLLEIAGGQCGPVTDHVSADTLPVRPTIELRSAHLKRLLGVAPPGQDVERYLGLLGMRVERVAEGWAVQPPSYRFDIEIEQDLVEEVARVYGYDNVPEAPAIAATILAKVTETRLSHRRLVNAIADRGYQEIISYSFVDEQYQKQIVGAANVRRLANPMSSEMSVMRVSLLPGLCTALQSNLARQRNRVRVFEFGTCFDSESGAPVESQKLAALACGPVHPEQWGDSERNADFFDIKADLEAVTHLTGRSEQLEYRKFAHPALHPGRAAEIFLDGQSVGLAGEMHPRLSQRLELPVAPVIFEIDVDAAFAAKIPHFDEISRFPAVRRDLAVVLDENVPVGSVSVAIQNACGSILRELRVFDIYRGKGIEAGRKSVAFGLILQETSRTLTDDDADRIVRLATQVLQSKYDATIRD